MKKDKPIQFRLSAEDHARIAIIKTHYGLATAAAAVRFAIKATVDKVPSNRRP